MSNLTGKRKPFIARFLAYFDDANRLTAESGTDGSGKSYSKAYTLDEAGNRQKLVSVLDSSTTTTNYSYNDLDWMTAQSVVAPTSTTNTSYDYDANGSQTGITTQVGAAAASYVKQV